MIALLTGWGLGKRAAQAIAYIGLPLLVIAALWLALHLYGNARYHAGEAHNEAKWQAASAKLKEQAAQSATRADDAAAKRLNEYAQQAAEDQEKVDEAIRNGSSPLDALFHP